MATNYKSIRTAANAYRQMFLGAAGRIVEQHARYADDENALKSMRELAFLGSLAFPGCYFHEGLEQVLWRIGERAYAEAAQPRCGATNPACRRILHVVTAVYAIGGHTRCLLDWIIADTSSQHGLALTEQAGGLPTIFWREKVQLGSIHFVAGRSLVERMNKLVQVAAGYDVVVFHHHPHDAVAAAGCAALTRAGCKTVFFNHASHSFAVGPTLASQAVAFSKGGAQFAQHFLPYDTIGVLPFLARREEPALIDVALVEAIRAKHRLNPGNVVVATVGTRLKFGDIKQNALFKVVAELMEDCSNVRFLVGVNEHGYAEQLAQMYPQFNVEQANERLVSLKMIADIYLDSMPVGGGLTHFEFAVWGVPVLSNYRSALGKGQPSRCVADGPEELAVTSRNQHRERLRQLVADAEMRRLFSGRTLKAIEKNHSIGAYREALESIYAEPAVRDRFPSKPCVFWNRAREFITWKQLNACSDLNARLRGLFLVLTAHTEQMSFLDYAKMRGMCMAPLKALGRCENGVRSTWIRDIASYSRLRLRRLLSKF